MRTFHNRSKEVTEQLRDAQGRFRRRTGLDILDWYGSCIMLGLLVLSPAWLIALVQCLEVQP